MLLSLLYVVLALLGLSFLIFIHELGHYWVARREGMRVEVFAIGFGKPIYSWTRNGVIWRLCCLPFGGYVKVAGMQKEGTLEPYEVPDGFYAKSPLARIRMAVAGPLANILFALCAFTLLWVFGGRTKPFTEFTHHIGWVDPHSSLYSNGIRPGDAIETYDGRAFQGLKDLQVSSLLSDATRRVQGYKVDYETGQKVPFDYTLPTYTYSAYAGGQLATIGVLAPARYLIYDEALIADAPIQKSGIQPQDRLLWVDGEWLFSLEQLSALINDSTAFLTVQRGEETIHAKVPRVPLNALRVAAFERDELDDWQHGAHLKGRLNDLYFIPYYLSYRGVVEGTIDFIDAEEQAKAFDSCQRCAYFHPLQQGDRILAVDGQPIANVHELMQMLQERHVQIIVQRDVDAASQLVLWTEADAELHKQMDGKDVTALVASLGVDATHTTSGSLHRLNPVVPQSLSQMLLSSEHKDRLVKELSARMKTIAGYTDTQQMQEALQQLEKSQKKLVLGISLKDREVIYNPSPWQQFRDTFDEMWRTLSGLVSGGVHPKYMSGPVGIVHIVQHSWSLGVGEALFWMGVISLNLGIFNLLPIPVLDGGHILFAAIEGCTRKRLSSKWMDRIIFPFVGFLILFFIYVTFQDVWRLIARL